MEIQKYALSFYPNSVDGIHIQRVEKPHRAKSPHTHMYYQIYYIAKGTLTHYIGGEEVLLGAGDMFILPPGAVHRIEDHDGLCFYSLSFMEEAVSEILQTTEWAAAFLHSLRGEPACGKILLPAAEARRMERIMEEIYTEFHANRNGCGEIIRLDIVRILALLARMTRSDGTATAEGTSGDEKQALLRCVAYIERNYYLPLTLENAAKMCALSRSVFCRSFRTLTGYSFHQYVNLCRIRRAQELLRRGDRITALYSFCGYGDFSTFYRNFVRIVGVSPAAYRRMHKGKEE